MQCENCGAPLALVHGREHFYCAFCGALHFPTELNASTDGLIPLGQPTEKTCPVCPVTLSVGAMEGREVAYCEQCRGILVSHDDFVAIVRSRRAQRSSPAATPVPFSRDELKRSIACPACGRRMEVHPYYGPGNVVIDSCAGCRMVWLDHGEAAAIEHAPGPR